LVLHNNKGPVLTDDTIQHYMVLPRERALVT